MRCACTVRLLIMEAFGFMMGIMLGVTIYLGVLIARCMDKCIYIYMYRPVYMFRQVYRCLDKYIDVQTSI